MALIEIDPLTGAIEKMEYNHNDKKLLFQREIDIDPVLELTAWSRNNPDKPWKRDKDMWHVATVPFDVFEMWRLEFNVRRANHPEDRIMSFLDDDPDWESFWWGKLNSSDWQDLKTAPVRIGREPPKRGGNQR